jgi:pyridoxal phosphate enzyme (YggS family)
MMVGPYDGVLSLLSSSLETRISAVEKRIVDAANRAGRPRTDITLVAVTKKFSAQTIREAYSAGLRHFGENYVQEFAGKRAELPEMADARFHLIGHLQSNKARLATNLFHTIQSVDSVKLLQKLDKAAEENGVLLEAYFELKLSDEESKSGAPEGDLPALAAASQDSKSVRIVGLMTVPPWSTDAETCRPYFRHLAELGRQFGFKELSMGMSNDFEVAIEEGATLVRVGTALFGARLKA